MAKSRHTRNGVVRKKKTKKRLNAHGGLRIPPVAIAFFFDKQKKLKFVYPVTGEHPDVTIRRTVTRAGLVPSPRMVEVTKRYWEIVQSLPSSAINISQTEIEKSIFDVNDEPSDQSIETGK